MEGVTTEQLQKDLHSFRKEIDVLINRAKELRCDSIGREMSLVHTKLQEAKMWTGKCLGATGSRLPEEYRDEA